MTAIYIIAGTSKQAHWSCLKRHQEREDQFLLLEALLAEERQKHPAMSLKKLYRRLAPGFVGRDIFIAWCMANGFETQLPRRFHATTQSDGPSYYPNLCHNLILIDINQLWVSDITYFKIGDVFFYIVFIMDVYSRKILGYHASDKMLAQANCHALRMALRSRGIDHYQQRLIHQSDKGGQYRSSVYTTILDEHGIRPSMGNCVFDNAHMESLNGIMKNEYLKHRSISSGQDLIRFLHQDVHLYNDERPHGSLDMMTPNEFERYICNIPMEQRARLPIYTDKSKKHNLLVLKPDDQQLKINFPGFIL